MKTPKERVKIPMLNHNTVSVEVGSIPHKLWRSGWILLSRKKKGCFLCERWQLAGTDSVYSRSDAWQIQRQRNMQVIQS